MLFRCSIGNDLPIKNKKTGTTMFTMDQKNFNMMLDEYDSFTRNRIGIFGESLCRNNPDSFSGYTVVIDQGKRTSKRIKVCLLDKEGDSIVSIQFDTNKQLNRTQMIGDIEKYSVFLEPKMIISLSLSPEEVKISSSFPKMIPAIEKESRSFEEYRVRSVSEPCIPFPSRSNSNIARDPFKFVIKEIAIPFLSHSLFGDGSLEPIIPFEDDSDVLSIIDGR